MEQELAEAVGRREEERRQWAERAGRADEEVSALRTTLEDLERERAERAGQEGELGSLREAEHASREALAEEKMEVARLEGELALMKEAELAAVQASRDTSESDGAEIVRLESELASMREAVVQADRDSSEREESEVDKLERELASLKGERQDAQKNCEILAEIWGPLRSLALEEAEEVPFPADLSLFLDTVQSIETQLTRLKEERSEREEHCVKLTHTVETLQGESMCL